ncbi:hypothetical protein EUX98_g4051 [Antrodiella citrinella]|uniref:YMC020W-like alpha/beta hydrolase domain-containing protein n=1 Tax=Antrodiella citrinella TaxID=2447956 RepID=A0A4S4MV20_9APHY|nr:hypothetical protein EUX98_g4051 [Antrodiella citrinella]
MSSRRRSNHPPPTWSKRSSQKPTAATGLSIIYAQPLQGSPLRSAIDNLPAIGIDDSASFMSEMSRKRERRSEEEDGDIGYETQKESSDGQSVSRSTAESTHSGIGIADSTVQDAFSSQTSQVIDLTIEGDPAIPSTSTAPVQAELTESPKTVTDFALPNPPIPAIDLPVPISVPNRDDNTHSRRSSWFSFSRSKVSLSVPESSISQVYGASAVSVDDIPEPAVPLSSYAPDSGRPQPDPTVAETQPVPSPLSKPASPTSPQILETRNTTSTISSVDEEVPPPKIGNASILPSDSPISLQAQDLNIPGRKPSVSSLNPSSSRFMLRIPLLGRPKIPLDQVVGTSSTNVSLSNTEEPSSPVIANAEIPLPAGTATESSPSTSVTPVADDPVSEVLSVSGPPTDDRAESTDQGAPTVAENANQEAVAAASSWWSYLGYGDTAAAAPDGHTSAVPDPPEVSESSAVSNDSSQTSDAAAVEPLPNTVDPMSYAPEPEPEHAHPGVQIYITASPSDDRPQSLLSETRSQASAWYSPWGWYGSSTTDVASSDSGALQGTDIDDNAKTESEMVKEEALARDDPTPTQRSPAIPEDQPNDVLPSPSPSANPIESSISTHRSGWASFFMSRALLTKSITDDAVKRDENGVEIMDLDDDEGLEAAGMPSSPRSVISAPGQPQDQALAGQSRPKSPIAPMSKQREPRKSGPVAAPLTNSESIKEKTKTATRPTSPAPSTTKKSGTSTPVQLKPQPPNLVLPTWDDTFRTLPRSDTPRAPPPPKSALSKTLSVVSGVLFAKDDQKSAGAKGKERQSDHDFVQFGKELPKAFDVLGQSLDPTLLSGDCRIVVIGVAGWSPGAVTRTIAGGLPSSSTKFVNMTCLALEKFEEDHGVRFKKITKIPLEGDGTIPRKVARVHAHLFENKEWVEDLHAADVIFIATHSQGSIVSTHLLDKLIREGHILTPRNVDILNSTAAMIAPGGSASTPRTQRICCLALCGIHLGPLRYLKTSSLLQPYIQYFENAAARELFEFQDTETETSKDYIKALRTVMDHGAKMVYIASLNDQVVPIYSGLFTAASHPRILRALYIDGDAYHSSDFLSNLLVLLLRIMNTGLSDSGLLAHLSEATAGTLSGIGHSTPYEELATYSLAVDYLFLANDGADVRTDLVIEPFNAVNEQNDYEIPWSLRDLIADERVARLFADEFAQLKNDFDDWQPRTSILRDVKRKLQPIQRLSSIRGSFSRL